MSRLNNTHLFLSLILAAFLCREAFLITLFPLFTGQDEARHYNTIQWLVEKNNSDCRNKNSTLEQDKDNLATYRFSEEIKRTSEAANLSVWREENYHKTLYSFSNIGPNELLVREKTWSRNTLTCPPDIVSKAQDFSLFHWTGSLIEKNFGEADILTRFYLIRLMGVFLGALTVALTYFAAVEAGFSRRVGLLLAFIVSLQPKLSVYTTNINYDVVLIPCFALFTFAGLHLLRHGFSPWNTLLLILAVTGATLTKGTGLILFGGLAFLIAWALFYHGKNWWQKLSRTQWLIGIILFIGLGSIVMSTYSLFNLFPSFHPSSLFEYLGKSLPKIPSSSTNFWGTISWTNSNHGHWFVWGIWAIEALAIFGLFRFFRKSVNPDHLPNKAAALFLLTLFVSLQFGVRLHDWHVFQETGSLALGTPGRYFLPTLLSQILLVAIGLGAFLKKSLLLERALTLLTLLVLAFHLYNTWLIILPRFYL